MQIRSETVAKEWRCHCRRVLITGEMPFSDRELAKKKQYFGYIG
jgi:hypothetical protein